MPQMSNGYFSFHLSVPGTSETLDFKRFLKSKLGHFRPNYHYSRMYLVVCSRDPIHVSRVLGTSPQGPPTMAFELYLRKGRRRPPSSFYFCNRPLLSEVYTVCFIGRPQFRYLYNCIIPYISVERNETGRIQRNTL